MIAYINTKNSKFLENSPKGLSTSWCMIYMPNVGRRTEKMKKVYRKEEGVSPVIATILMVAITVVLAATVYIMVAGIYGPGTNKLIASLTYDQTQSNPTGGEVYLRVSMSTPSSAQWTNVKITIRGTGGPLSGQTGNSINGYTVDILDYDASGTLTDGDVIHIYGGADLSGATIALSITGYSGNAQVTIPS